MNAQALKWPPRCAHLRDGEKPYNTLTVRNLEGKPRLCELCIFCAQRIEMLSLAIVTGPALKSPTEG